MKKTLIIMRGPQGSGKTTLAQKRNRELGGRGVILATDDYFYINGQYAFDPVKLQTAHGWNHDRCHEAMEKGFDPIIIDNVCSQAWEAKRYCEMAWKFGYHVEFLMPNTPWMWDPDECYQRQTKFVPLESVVRTIAMFDRRSLSFHKVMNSEVPAARRPGWQKMPGGTPIEDPKVQQRLRERINERNDPEAQRF